MKEAEPMKSSAGNEVKGKLQKVKGKSEMKSEKLNDPTLEGKDESKMGRIQVKS
jgi:hypothetical protein